MTEPKKKKPFQWGFRSATITILAIALWTELLVHLADALDTAEGAGRLLYGLAFFLCVLPWVAAVVYAWPVVFGFFRSVKVGITNLVFIGLASIAGVLFYQEDPNFPIAPESPLGDLVQVSPQRLQHFDKFRDAHVHFTYKFVHGASPALYHALPGVRSDCLVDARAEDNAQKLATLEKNLAEQQVVERFGEEYTVALTSQSEVGLRNQAQNAEMRELGDDWKDGWWTLFHYADVFDFVRVYKSDWFAAFWVILLGGVVSNTFRGGWRRLLRPQKWGFVVTHAGVIILVLGAFWGRFTEIRGILNLNIGLSSDQFITWSRKPTAFQPTNLFEKPVGVPFKVKLDAFRADYHDVLDVVYAVRRPDGGVALEYPDLRPPKFRVYEGQKLYFDYGPGDPSFLDEPRDPAQVPHFRVEILEYVPQSDLQPILIPAPEGSRFGQPLAAVAIRNAEGQPEVEQVLSELMGEPLVHPLTGTRIQFRHVHGAEEAAEVLGEPVPEVYGWLSQPDTSGEAILLREGVAPGSRLSLEAGGKLYEVEVLDAQPMPRLSQDEEGRWVSAPAPQGIERQEALNPAVLVRLTDPDGESEERWVFQSSFHNMGRRFTDVDLRFEWDAWSSPAASRLIVFLLGGPGAAEVLVGEAGDPTSLVPLEVGGTLPLVDGHELELRGAEAFGTLEMEIAEVEGADFFHPAPGAVRVRTTTPNGAQEFVMSTAIDGQWISYTGPGGGERLLKLIFREDTDDMPKEWQSKLSFFQGVRLVDGRPGFEASPSDSGHIRVNDYEVFEGYRFFQTNWDKGDPTYSGIGIVYDPGIEMVLLGLYLVTFGTFIVFIINPLVTKRHRGI